MKKLTAVGMLIVVVGCLMIAAGIVGAIGSASELVAAVERRNAVMDDSMDFTWTMGLNAMMPGFTLAALGLLASAKGLEL